MSRCFDRKLFFVKKIIHTSIRLSISTVQIPRIPPPSIHKIRTPLPTIGRRLIACLTISFSPKIASARVAYYLINSEFSFSGKFKANSASKLRIPLIFNIERLLIDSKPKFPRANKPEDFNSELSLYKKIKNK